MNQDDFEQPQETVINNLPLPGQLVSQAREQRGLSLRELSEKTRLTENVLSAIERDDFQAMGEPVYARGYYRKCAAALSLNADALVEAYEQHSGTASPVPTIDQRPSIAYRERPSKLALAITVVLMLFVFAASALWLWEEEHSLETVERAPLIAEQEQASSDSPQTLIPATAEPSEQLAVTEQPEAEAATSATPAPRPQAAPQQAAPVVAQSRQAQRPVSTATAAPTTQTRQPPSLGEALVRLEVSGGEAWVDIRDREGRKLIYKLLQTGNVREVQGQTPLRVSLGRADHVKLMLNGRAIDFSSQLREGLTAIFLIDASGRLYNADAGTAP